MSLAVLNTAHNAPTLAAPTTSVTLPASTTVGSVLVAIVNSYDAVPAAGSVTDSFGNTWTQDHTTGGGTAKIWIAVYSTRLATAGASHVVTFSQAGITSIINLDVAEIAGVLISGRLDTHVTVDVTSLPPYTAGPSGVLAQPDEIAFASVSVDTGEAVVGGLTQDATWTLIGEQEFGTADVSSVVYKILASAATTSHVWQGLYSSCNWVTAIVTYKAAAEIPTGTVAAIDGPDVAVITGTFTAPSGVAGTIGVTETNDVAALVGTFTAGTNVDGTIAAIDANDVAAIVGTVVNPAPTFRYPVAVSGRKWIDQFGAPMLFKDVSSWGMIQNLSNAEITQALTGLAARHFNCALACLFGVRSTGAGWSPFVNKAGQAVFTGTPYQSALGPAWASCDWFVSECSRLGLIAGLSLWISQTNDGPQTQMEAATNAQLQAFGAAVAARYAAVPNIVWHVMGDQGWDPTNAIGQRVDAFFQGVRSTEGGTPRLICAEPYNGGTSNQMYISKQADKGYSGGYQYLKLNANSPYNYGSNAAEIIDSGYNESGATTYPVWDCEPPYVGADHYAGTAAQQRQQFRERNYAGVLRGGVGENWGHESWWPFGYPGLYSPPETWQQVMTAVEAFEAQYGWDLLDVYCTDPTFAPDDVSISTGTGAGDTKAAIGRGANALVVYFPTTRTVVVNTTLMTGTGNVRLQWYDPTTASFALISASEAQTTSRTVTYPSSRADGSSDYVLVVDLAGVATGTIAAIETPDVAVIVGTVTSPTEVTGTATMTEANDVAVIVGSFVGGPVVGVINAVETNDVAVIVGDLPGQPDAPSGQLVVSVTAAEALNVDVSQT